MKKLMIATAVCAMAGLLLAGGPSAKQNSSGSKAAKSGAKRTSSALLPPTLTAGGADAPSQTITTIGSDGTIGTVVVPGGDDNSSGSSGPGTGTGDMGGGVATPPIIVVPLEPGVDGPGEPLPPNPVLLGGGPAQSDKAPAKKPAPKKAR